MPRIRVLASLALLLGLGACTQAPVSRTAADPYRPQPYVQIQTPAWAKSATIYQLNTRQFTAEGTFRAVEKQLPRLKALGAVIIWLMPIHEIGVKNRKRPLGSPYSVKDYYSVNPEFGTEGDLRAFIDSAHALGMKVILDWVGLTTPPGTTRWLPSTPSGTSVTGKGRCDRRRGGTGRTSSTWIFASPACASM